MAIGALGYPTGYDQPTQSSVSKQKFKNSQSPQDDDFESPPKKPPTKSATQAPEKPPSKAAQSTAKDLGDPDESSEPRKAARKSRKKNNDKKLSDESKGKEKEKFIKKKKKKRKPKKKSGQRDAPSDSDDEDGKWGVGQVKGVLVIKILTQSRSWGISKKQNDLETPGGLTQLKKERSARVCEVTLYQLSPDPPACSRNVRRGVFEATAIGP
ncbi:hypothetical protein D6C79_04805 [Aureobasidium pullulans]|nr:hypothetical protein D6C79_04805 [Aureobasidium pullulans]